MTAKPDTNSTIHTGSLIDTIQFQWHFRHIMVRFNLGKTWPSQNWRSFHHGKSIEIFGYSPY